MDERSRRGIGRLRKEKEGRERRASKGLIGQLTPSSYRGALDDLPLWSISSVAGNFDPGCEATACSQENLHTVEQARKLRLLVVCSSTRHLLWIVLQHPVQLFDWGSKRARFAIPRRRRVAMLRRVHRERSTLSPTEKSGINRVQKHRDAYGPADAGSLSFRQHSIRCLKKSCILK